MTPTTCPRPASPPRARRARRVAPLARPPLAAPAPPSAVPLGRYTARDGRPREVLALPGRGASTLVVDRDALSWGDRRLVAHLAPDEPPENARLVCRDYLGRAASVRCRALVPDDLRTVPFGDGCQTANAVAFGREQPVAPPDAATQPDAVGQPATPPGAAERPATQPGAATPPDTPEQSATPWGAAELRDRSGRLHRLAPLATGRSLPELRWCVCEDASGRAAGRRVAIPGEEGGASPCAERTGAESVRDVVACMESYEPVRALTAAALARHREDPAVSVAALRSELERLDASRIVLNRGLRRAVMRAIRTEQLTLSEIALRCGRIKHSAGGRRGGETSWLARRVGMVPEGGSRGEPTPWIHSEVLALIAREGLGLSPHEVEL